MPTTLELINFEKLAAIIFIISSFQALSSSFKAEQAELEKQQGTEVSSGMSTATAESNKLALDSTWLAVIAYLIYLIVSILRKNQIEQKIQSGTTNMSIIPNIIIVTGFIVSVLGGIIRIPAIQQRLAEAQVPVIL